MQLWEAKHIVEYEKQPGIYSFTVEKQTFLN